VTPYDGQRRARFDALARAARARGSARAAGRIACPCCGYPTLSEREAHDICCLCYWEDDGQDDPRADEVWEGPNGSYSLAEARENFRNNLVMYGRSQPDPRVSGPDSRTEIQAKRAMIAAFECMLETASATDRELLWVMVLQSEAVIDSERNRKYEEYEARRQLSV